MGALVHTASVTMLHEPSGNGGLPALFPQEKDQGKFKKNGVHNIYTPQHIAVPCQTVAH